MCTYRDALHAYTRSHVCIVCPRRDSNFPEMYYVRLLTNYINSVLFKMFTTKKIYLDAFRKGKQQCIKLIILKRTHMCNDMTHNVTMYKSDITVNRNGNE